MPMSPAGRLRFAIALALLALLAGIIACNLPTIATGDVAEGTPWIVYVTATPDRSTFWAEGPTPTQPPIGPYGAGVAPPLVFPATEPPLDLSGVTPVPTSSEPQATIPATESASLAPVTPTPTGGPTPTLPATVTPMPTPTTAPTATGVPTATPLPQPSPTPRPPQQAAAGQVFYSGRLGLNFISSAQHQADNVRFAAGIGTGVGWDRFAIYWNEIELRENEYTWAVYDQTVAQDVSNGLATNAILLGTPPMFAQSGSVPRGIYEPVFADGSDTPGAGKRINPSNPWAEFVYAAVSRYKPGGMLARTRGWAPGQGVQVWEIWNEPDFSTFWQGSVGDYARLLKVAYIAIQQADPAAKVMLGGLVIWEKPAWLIDLLTIYKNDPSPASRRYPFHILALHAYSYPYNAFQMTQRTESLLAIYGINDVPIWINESGVPVWDDYPGPTWATRLDQITWRATQAEQASYVIQNAAYAFLAEADVLFHFQLYDDCGNQPRGTTFAPHDGSLCSSGAVCWGDALGLMRNTSGNVCFNQHPQPGTARPAYAALRVVADVFGGEQVVPLSADRIGPEGKQVSLILARPGTGEVITVLWNESAQAAEIKLYPRSDRAVVIDRSGTRRDLTLAEDGRYHLTLEPATNRNQQGLGTEFMIGGPPLIVIEPLGSWPVVSIAPLLDNSRQAVTVKWRASYPAAFTLYEVWYRDDTSGSGEWNRWFETTSPGDALFVGEPGHTYSFFARGRFSDGTWTHDNAYPQAQTRLGG
ncbi:MAG: hypothetical protein Kow00124_31340 [Anaerolineae bacterium]